MRFVSIFIFLTSIFWGCLQGASTGGPVKDNLKPFIGWLLEDGDRLENVRFAEVVEAVSGCKVLPIDGSKQADREFLEALQSVGEAMLIEFSQAEHPVHEVGRINETSRYIEEYLLRSLDALESFSCGIPLNASGEIQRSGYPDLRVEHLPSGRIFYLDPKVYKASSETSSFRTFYFEPKGETNKILEDASHLILGVSHGGKVDGLWQLQTWKLVDLIGFRVRLKAEFQSNNRELYREDAVIIQSESTD